MGITRRAAIAAVSLLSAVSLAACGGSASNSSTNAASGAASASASGVPQKATGELKVLAAASLKASFTEIGTQLEKNNPGLHVTFDFQGSQTLVSSLSEGNAADALATALFLAEPQALEDAGFAYEFALLRADGSAAVSRGLPGGFFTA